MGKTEAQIHCTEPVASKFQVNWRCLFTFHLWGQGLALAGHNYSKTEMGTESKEP